MSDIQIAVDGATIEEVRINPDCTEVEVKFTAQIAGADDAAKRSEPGKTILNVLDIWTFRRRHVATNPIWTVVAVKGYFEGFSSRQ